MSISGQYFQLNISSSQEPCTFVSNLYGLSSLGLYYYVSEHAFKGIDLVAVLS